MHVFSLPFKDWELLVSSQHTELGNHVCLEMVLLPVELMHPSSLSYAGRYHIVNNRWEEQIDVARVQEVKDRFLQLPGVLDIEEFLSGWFHGAPFESIQRDNVMDFVAYGFYSQNVKDLSIKVLHISVAAVM